VKPFRDSETLPSPVIGECVRADWAFDVRLPVERAPSA
jgi:hypothetical protein